MDDSVEPVAQAGPSMSRPDLETVYTQYASFVWRVLRGMGVHEAAVADAVQDVFIVVHRRYPEFDHRFKVRTWLFEIAYRVARDYRRKAARARSLYVFDDQDAVAEAADPSTANLAEQSDRMRLLGKLLDRLDDDKRAVLILAEFEGLTAPEIAKVIGVPLNTTYARLRRARAAFNEALAAHQRRQM